MLVAFNPELTGYHEIRANSYQTEEWYNDIGKFTLVVPPTKYNITHLVKGAILFRTKINQAMVVTRVSPDTSQDRITVNGYTTNWLLNKRAIATPMPQRNKAGVRIRQEFISCRIKTGMTIPCKNRACQS